MEGIETLGSKIERLLGGLQKNVKSDPIPDKINEQEKITNLKNKFGELDAKIAGLEEDRDDVQNELDELRVLYEKLQEGLKE